MADFVTGTGFDDLPPEVIHEMKRVILDSVGCAIIGQTTERGEAAVKLAQRLAGPPESTIFGTNSKVSCTNAAFANGESMNALDYDALSAAAVHDVPILVPAVLAMAESTGSTGKDVLLALALSFEISARLKAAGAQAKMVADKAPRTGLQWSQVLGYSAVTLAAAAGAGRILNLDMQEMANAIGIAGGICPPNIFRKFTDTSPINMIKYASTGWEAQAGITAALLAETGYTGDTGLFQGDYGYWNYTGMGNLNEEAIIGLLEDLGSQWQSYKINYKQYPCCGHISGTMDQFIRIINEHDIKPEEVTGITAYMDSLSQFRVFKENVLQLRPGNICDRWGGDAPAPAQGPMGDVLTSGNMVWAQGDRKHDRNDPGGKVPLAGTFSPYHFGADRVHCLLDSLYGQADILSEPKIDDYSGEIAA